jgi:hypothetical protein
LTLLEVTHFRSSLLKRVLNHRPLGVVRPGVDIVILFFVIADDEA